MDSEQTRVAGPGDGTTAQPTVTPDPQGQPAVAETPEQIAQSRAYYQTKAQEEIRLRKEAADKAAALETDLNAARQALEQRSPISFNQQMVDLGIDPATQPDTRLRDERGRFQPAQPQPQLGEPEYDPNDPATWIKASARESASMVLTALEQREAQKTQAQKNAAYQEGLQIANQYFNDVVTKHAVPQPLIRESMKYAFKFVKGQEPGDPERRASLAIDYIQNNMRVSYGAQIESVQQLSDAQKIEAAKLLQQPASAAPGAPAPSSQAQLQHKRYVDDIAPDDPPVG